MYKCTFSSSIGFKPLQKQGISGVAVPVDIVQLHDVEYWLAFKCFWAVQY